MTRYCVQADDKKEEHWVLHGAVDSCPTSRGAHLNFLSVLLKKNTPDGTGFIVGSALSIADCVLLDILELYVRVFPTQIEATVCCCSHLLLGMLQVGMLIT